VPVATLLPPDPGGVAIGRWATSRPCLHEFTGLDHGDGPRSRPGWANSDVKRSASTPRSSDTPRRTILRFPTDQAHLAEALARPREIRSELHRRVARNVTYVGLISCSPPIAQLLA
jgi:hypothetical protein